ncbi:5-hydroxytryptamine receptor 4 [Exaiptasia diaphana]|nr:5-hydroxytryptamine receptor 4 [Exaiptasia diaphana]
MYTLAEKIFLSIFLIVVIVFGVVGNTFVIAATVRFHRLRRNVSNYLLLNLAISDLLSSSVIMPYHLASVINLDIINDNGLLCQIGGTLSYPILLTSTLTLVMLAIDRFIAMSDPLRYRARITFKAISFMISYTWLHSTFFTIFTLLLVDMEFDEVSLDCGVAWQKSPLWFALLSMLLNIVFPFLFVALTSLRVLSIAKSHHKQIASEVQVYTGQGPPRNRTRATYVGPAVLKKIDPDQFGGIPKSSTLYALISMLHHWLQATDGTGAAIRIVLFDYRKAFDLIDHNILVTKIKGLDIPHSALAWVTDFLTHRQQRVKLSADCLSEWGPVPAGVPQGTKLGPWLFLLMINDLKIDALTWKYVDDTTISHVIPRDSLGDVQLAVTTVEDWSQSQRMQLNADKCKELIIDFKKNSHNFSPLEVEVKELPVVDRAKILGATISKDLKWNDHIAECIKKANKRLYFIVLLKRVRVPANDIVNFYCSTIRPVLEY